MELYNNLKSLMSNDAFYVSNQVDHDGSLYEIFLYRLASYSDFQEAGGVEARGIMFSDGVCVSRPMAKFWNFTECNQWPEHVDTDWSEYSQCMVKEDGSLISTWIDKSNKLRCKSKGSLHSDQAKMAEEYLLYSDILRSLYFFTRMGYTVNMELVSPDNRIVLSYPDTKLVVLNIRHNLTGEYLSKRDACIQYPSINDFWVKYVDGVDMVDVPSMNGVNGEVIEGFIYRHPDTGHMVKCKTDRYVEIHHAKDDVNNPKRLMTCVLEEGSDDLRSLFENDDLTLKYITEFEKMVFSKYNNMIDIVEDYYDDYKDLIQKDYAIQAQNKDYLVSRYFSLAMSMYSGKEVRYKDYMIKNRKFLFPEINWVVT